MFTAMKGPLAQWRRSAAVMQGYLFGRPMRTDKIADYLSREQSLRRIEGRRA